MLSNTTVCVWPRGATVSPLVRARSERTNLLKPAPDGTEIRSTGSFDVRLVRFESLADILTSQRHFRFYPDNGRWAAHPNSTWLLYELRRALPTLCLPI